MQSERVEMALVLVVNDNDTTLTVQNYLGLHCHLNISNFILDEGVSKSFRTESITKSTTTIKTR
jgi:hypothetical protein